MEEFCLLTLDMFAFEWSGDSVLLDCRGCCKAEFSMVQYGRLKAAGNLWDQPLDVCLSEFAAPEQSRTWITIHMTQWQGAWLVSACSLTPVPTPSISGNQVSYYCP